jgi:resuscitation-promoting factor RpfA
VRIDSEATALTVISGAFGIVAALTFSAPTAFADPAPPAPWPPPFAAPAFPAPAPPVAAADPVIPAPAPMAAPPPPAPWLTPFVAPAIPAPAPAVAAADPVIPAPAPMAAPAPGPGPDSTIQTAAVDPATPPDGVPHLSSPENLPPGTTDVPPDAGQPRTLGYLRDLWHAVQTQEVSGRDALLLLTQRPMNPDSAPPPGLAANPTPPLGPGAPAPLAEPLAEPAPAPLAEPAPAPPAEPALPLLPPPAPAP